MALNTLVFVLITVFSFSHTGLGDTCGSSITDTFDDVPVHEALGVYNGLDYSSAWAVGYSSLANSPNNALWTSATTEDPRFLAGTLATVNVVSGYALFEGLYLGCANSIGAVRCVISINGTDINGAAVPEVIFNYTEPVTSKQLLLLSPAEGEPIKYTSATFRVKSSADGTWVTQLLLDNIKHTNCEVGGTQGVQITQTVTTLYPASTA
ncbi:hypothetical protein LTR56_002261 [Elasticomyces elasticus]|nr:hypothetical protein LTR56_002261 [Elasticomyces elasticus]KAK3666138.1 hypothetical protein LTR22_003144 [Elasticomyces elasticus]KAK4908420.1 hypothetical protein LTR49_022688 [Elasticomyces elasticus]KAK5767418.1 hypothetical protein LTS12_002256 [Elasticomyces elasticus]